MVRLGLEVRWCSGLVAAENVETLKVSVATETGTRVEY